MRGLRKRIGTCIGLRKGRVIFSCPLSAQLRLLDYTQGKERKYPAGSKASLNEERMVKLEEIGMNWDNMTCKPQGRTISHEVIPLSKGITIP